MSKIIEIEITQDQYDTLLCNLDDKSQEGVDMAFRHGLDMYLGRSWTANKSIQPIDLSGINKGRQEAQLEHKKIMNPPPEAPVRRENEKKKAFKARKVSYEHSLKVWRWERNSEKIDAEQRLIAHKNSLPAIKNEH